RAAGGQSRAADAAAQGRRLGRFIGRLHATTCNDNQYAEPFDNRSMQETRLAVQYRGVTEMLRTGGVEDAEALGARAKSLGQELLEPGRCLTMGDLWPPSVLVEEEGPNLSGLRLIDWELAHYGRPLQDVAHWCAHLWMQQHRAPSEPVAEAVTAHRTAFLATYSDALGDAEAALWTDAERRDAAVHFGAEILVRADGGRASPIPPRCRHVPPAAWTVRTCHTSPVSARCRAFLLDVLKTTIPSYGLKALTLCRAVLVFSKKPCLSLP
ncbi:MAG: hypothetical protein BRD53_06145, partial [Bacteroidetes bacterium SW_7_64_58]